MGLFSRIASSVRNVVSKVASSPIGGFVGNITRGVVGGIPVIGSISNNLWDNAKSNILTSSNISSVQPVIPTGAGASGSWGDPIIPKEPTPGKILGLEKSIFYLITGALSIIITSGVILLIKKKKRK